MRFRHITTAGQSLDRRDQQSPVSDTASSGSDFDGSDAGIGAGAAICLAASLAAATVMRRRTA